MTHLTLRVKSNKTDAKEVSYEASYMAPLTRKTRLRIMIGSKNKNVQKNCAYPKLPAGMYNYTLKF